jgi:C1A family cysteine protease
MALSRGKTSVSSISGYGGAGGSSRQIARFGWIPDLPDHRDFTYMVPRSVLTALPPSADLRPQCPAVYDQEQIGSCTANAIAGAIEFDQMKQGIGVFTPSRLFIYYNERAMQGWVGIDSGAFIRDGIKSVAKLGCCPEDQWPYDGRPANPGDSTWPPGHRAAKKPSPKCYKDALKHKIVEYRSIARNVADMKGCLAAGFPFVFGFTVYESFRSVTHNGEVPLPSLGEKVIGGHAVLAVGYADDEQKFVCRNSWGDQWGDAGYFYMPYAYLLDSKLSDDFWTVRLTQ